MDTGAVQETVGKAADVERIMEMIPHRVPFLMIDRAEQIVPDVGAIGVKNVTILDPHFRGHFPSRPVMPGVLIIEAMAQIGGILLSQELEHKGKIPVLLSLDKVKFRRSVSPGDQLILTAETIRVTSRGGQLKCIAAVANDLVAEAIVKFAMTDADPV